MNNNTKFKRYQKLKKSLQKHSKEVDARLLQCPYCKNMFKTPIELTDHMMPMNKTWKRKAGMSPDEPLKIYYDFPRPDKNYDIPQKYLEPRDDDPRVGKVRQHHDIASSTMGNEDDNDDKDAVSASTHIKSMNNWIYPKINDYYRDRFLPQNTRHRKDTERLPAYNQRKKTAQKKANHMLIKKVRHMIAKAFKEYERLLNVKFIYKKGKIKNPRLETLDRPQLRFTLVSTCKARNKNTIGFAHYPQYKYGGDIFLILDLMKHDSYQSILAVILHEIGHALGLRHRECDIEEDKTNRYQKKKEIYEKDQKAHYMTCMSPIMAYRRKPNSATFGRRTGLGAMDVLALAKHYGISKKHQKSKLFYIRAFDRMVDIVSFDNTHPKQVQKDIAGFGFTLSQGGYKTLWVGDDNIYSNPFSIIKTRKNKPMIFNMSPGLSGTNTHYAAIASLDRIQEVWGGNTNDIIFGHDRSTSYGGRGNDRYIGGHLVILDKWSGHDTFDVKSNNMFEPHRRGRSIIAIEGVKHTDIRIYYYSSKEDFLNKKTRNRKLRRTERMKKSVTRNGKEIPIKIVLKRYPFAVIYYDQYINGVKKRTNSMKISNPKKLKVELHALGKDNYLLRSKGKTINRLTNKPFHQQSKTFQLPIKLIKIAKKR